MEIDELVQAIQTLNADDAFRARLSAEQWRSIAPYLPRLLAAEPCDLPT